MKHDTPQDFFHRHHRGDEPHLLREIVRTHQVMMFSFSRHIGMPGSKFMLLRLLATTEEAVGVMDLARMLDINAAAITRQVQELEAEGLIQRRPDGRDKRRQYLYLSDQGRETFEEIHSRSHRLESALTEAVSTAEMEAAAGTLQRIRTFIENYHEEKEHDSQD